MTPPSLPPGPRPRGASHLCTQDHGHSVLISLPTSSPLGFSPASAFSLPVTRTICSPSTMSHSVSPSQMSPSTLTWTTPAHRLGHPLRPSTELSSLHRVSLFAASRSGRGSVTRKCLENKAWSPRASSCPKEMVTGPKSRPTSEKNTERMTRLIQCITPANWNALETAKAQ